MPGRPSDDRVRGAWLGRAIGCVLGKPVEKIPREGIRAIAEATGNWPITGYFTEVGLPADIAQRWPWNRRSRVTSLVETLDGIPEDDDLNFTMLALAMVERHGDKLATADVAQAWLDNLPAGRVFTAERAAYRNLLLGYRARTRRGGPQPVPRVDRRTHPSRLLRMGASGRPVRRGPNG